MMYEELIHRLREESEIERWLQPHSANETPKLLDDAADAIEGLEKSIPRWIPVTERLPKNIDDEVLVCTEDYGKSGLGFVTVAIYDGSDWLECWQRKTYLTAVTHWMPLPEPPKEG